MASNNSWSVNADIPFVGFPFSVMVSGLVQIFIPLGSFLHLLSKTGISNRACLYRQTSESLHKVPQNIHGSLVFDCAQLSNRCPIVER